MISAPACYGKIPAYGDFYQYRAFGLPAEAWWSWFARAGEKCALSPAPAPPWCFVMPPGVMSWSGRNFVFGALGKSRDRVGRGFPLVIWQIASANSLFRLLKEAVTAPLELNWLFWVSRMLRGGESGAYSDGQGEFGVLVDRLWAMFKPGLAERLGLGKRRAPPAGALREIAGELEPDGLAGVRRMPWADWPYKLSVPGAPACFWAMDNQGRHLEAFMAKSLDDELFMHLFAWE